MTWRVRRRVDPRACGASDDGSLRSNPYDGLSPPVWGDSVSRARLLSLVVEAFELSRMSVDPRALRGSLSPGPQMVDGVGFIPVVRGALVPTI